MDNVPFMLLKLPAKEVAAIEAESAFQFMKRARGKCGEVKVR